MKAEKVRNAVEIREARENREATRRYVGHRSVLTQPANSAQHGRATGRTMGKPPGKTTGRARIGIYSNDRQVGWLVPVCDAFGLRYVEDAKNDVSNLEWGDVVEPSGGPVQEWTRSEWEAGGTGAYVAALSLLCDVVPLSVAWTAVWRFTREVVLELPRTEAEIRSREAERGFYLSNLTSGFQRANPELKEQKGSVDDPIDPTDASAPGTSTLPHGGQERDKAQWEMTRDEIYRWVYPNGLS